jgi:prevent-host-death family protein
MQINVRDAKSSLSKLIQHALDGEEVILAGNGEPAVRLVPINQRALLRPLGLGRIRPRKNFLERPMAPLSDEDLAAWNH